MINHPCSCCHAQQPNEESVCIYTIYTTNIRQYSTVQIGIPDRNKPLTKLNRLTDIISKERWIEQNDH